MIDGIKLSVVSSEEIDRFLALWDADLNFDPDPTAEESWKHPLKEFVAKNQAADPIRSILAAVRYHYQAFALLESPYMDLEFWDSHGAYYGGSFSKYDKSCVRLHFFSEPSNAARTPDLLVELLNGGANRDGLTKAIPDLKYRGFCVLRPTNSFVVGRAAIEFDKRNPQAHGLDERPIPDSEKNAIPCLTVMQRCEVHLLSATFHVNAPEFIQQDPNLGQCATASLWVASRALAGPLGTKQLHYRSITNRAISLQEADLSTLGIYDPLDAEGGLSIPEIRTALAATGLNSLRFMPSPDEEPEETLFRLPFEIYAFVESGLPVLLCTEQDGVGHVVAAVGHSLPVNPEVSQHERVPRSMLNGLLEANDDVPHATVSNLVRLYYAHDDSYGPYNRVRLLHETVDGPDGTGIKVALGRLEKTGILKDVIVPVSPMIRNSAYHSFYNAVRYFQARYGESFQDDGEHLMWRPVLLQGSEFKSSLGSRGYSDTVRAWYAKLHLPKYVWLFEISVAPADRLGELFPSDGARTVLGEFLYDATCPNTDVRLLAERLLGTFRYAKMGYREFRQDPSARMVKCYEPTPGYAVGG